jgi:hypothetical protein
VHFRGKTMAEKHEFVTASRTINQTFSSKSGVQWR